MTGARGFLWTGCLLMFICFVSSLKITEDNLKSLLTEAEWSSIMGASSDAVPEYSLVYPRQKHPRIRRSVARHLELHAPALQRRFSLEMMPSPALTASEFQLVATWSNHSEELPTKEVHQEIGCYYRGDNSALSICGGIRGIVSSDNNEYFIIHPLPQRLQETTASDIQPHVIVRRPASHPYSTPQPRGPICAHQDFDNQSSKKFWKKHRRKEANTNRVKRALLSLGSPVFVETAVFVDRDLFQHMRANYPVDTERELVRFVLAMINAVQLLYHDPSLGRPVNFVLKRLEILHEEPSGLARPHDIDRFLSSFCSWQRLRNPPGDQDPQHWDHALILTGLDLYVVGKRGKVSSQVVGLAPVAGMCTMTSSCTVNEGRHFESVYVVAHEIGHNLGMRHDGPLADNDCDPSSYIMSPTLGSGKITWSPCSRRYLQKFLETSQSRCLLDHGSSAGQLDHSAEGALPGERFDADQQCMLKYGRGSKHSLQQPLDDVCRDLHCQRERYTWTSHPALEGTTCGHQQWCRGGRCVARGVSAPYTTSGGSSSRSGAVVAAQSSGGLSGSIDGGWSEWRSYSDCASGCLYGEEGRLRAGSTGIMVSTRRCNRPRPEGGGRPCQGPDRRFQACSASQCLNVPRMTVREFAVQICERAREVDTDLNGAGLQRTSADPEEACMVWCLKRNGDTKNRGWTFPDGTVCQTRRVKFGRQSYCINGRCEEFECPKSDTLDIAFLQHPDLCPLEGDDTNELGWRGGSKQRRRDSGAHWVPASGCHFNCMTPGTGVRLVLNKADKRRSSIQLCQPDKLGCGRIKSPFQHATTVCSKYKERVRRLSGLGMQISAAVEDPDRPCRVACQDENVSHRFYLVNGEDGWFPFGTDCSRGSSDKKSYCISGKCLEFGPDETPLSENEFTLPLLSRSKRSLETNKTRVIATLQQQDLDLLISRLNLTLSGPINSGNLPPNNQESFDIDLTNPIFVEMNMPPYAMQPYTYYRENEVQMSRKGRLTAK